MVILQFFLQLVVLLHYKVAGFVIFCGILGRKIQDNVSCLF